MGGLELGHQKSEQVLPAGVHMDQFHLRLLPRLEGVSIDPLRVPNFGGRHGVRGFGVVAEFAITTGRLERSEFLINTCLGVVDLGDELLR